MMKFKKLLSVIVSIVITASLCTPITVSAANEEQIRDKIVSVASNEVGYTGSSTYSKYGDWYGYQGGWCTTFVMWCYNKAGNDLGISLYGNVIPSGGNCNSMISWYENNGRYHRRGDGYSPKAGDLVFFDWSGNGSSQHVGIVNYVSGSTVYTIEGNCSGQVKAREYTVSGSKPYNNVSAIMGYGAPNFSNVSSGGSSNTTAKKTTAKKAATKRTTSQKSTTKKQTTTTTEKVTTETTVTTTEIKMAEKLSIAKNSYDLKVGDTVKLDYTIEPKNTRAVVEYFCDEEGIIQLDASGDITAIGSGNATVVVCANNELYNQCSITVNEAAGEVTTLIPDTTMAAETTIAETEINIKSIFTNAGINVDLIIHNRQLCIITISIIAAFSAIAVIITSAKKAKRKHPKQRGD